MLRYVAACDPMESTPCLWKLSASNSCGQEHSLETSLEWVKGWDIEHLGTSGPNGPHVRYSKWVLPESMKQSVQAAASLS